MIYSFSLNYFLFITIMNPKLKLLLVFSLIFTLGIPFAFFFSNINHFIIISSNSMVPTINIGDMVYYEFIEPEEIVADSKDNGGDIVVIDGPSYFYENGLDPSIWNDLSNNTPIIHRAVSKIFNVTENQWYFETRGDFNPFSDGCLRGEFNNGVAVYNLNFSRPILIPESKIKGIILLIIPYLGLFGLYYTNILIGVSSIIILMVIINLFGYEILLKVVKRRS